ncbi:hypothetical protein BHE90_006788 [Fusarium euwallaceae]|uniref:Uncharacterized protein n=1 Tax=Fusarium euwallaceae TaxID=1147111 RepID=A0A430LSP0_9HYPO|nr:hypothetical protein BHE90_006788 [Fusarium euwallaceae]
MARGFTSDEPTYPPDSHGFPLYKNTEFLNCSSVPVKPIDCKALKKLLGDARVRNVLVTPFYKMGRRPQMVFDWCTAMQCFKGYKVIPSRPYPSAHIPNNFSVWVSFNIAMLSLLWFLRRYLQSARKSQGGRETRGGCDGLGSLEPLDWFFLLFDFVGAFLWWWISFFFSVADSRQWSSMSFAAWTVTWRHAFDLQYHPYSCALEKYPKWSGRIKRLCHLLVVAQWCATIYAMIIWMRWRYANIVPPGYQCLQDEIANAPGTSPCSPAKLCSQDRLFKSYYPGLNYEDSIGPKLFLWHISEWTVLVIMIAIRSRLSDKEAQAEKDKPAFWYTIMVVIGVAAGVSVYFDVDIALDYFSQRHVVNHYAPVAFSEECHAVHVALSPWKHYFDVDTGWRALWIAKAWLDA